MSLTDRFQLLDLKRDDGARTYLAREIATGRPVLVHLIADPQLSAKLDALPEGERMRILDRGDHEGGVYVVTDRLADYPGLREWLADKSIAPKIVDPPKALDAAGAWKIKPPAADTAARAAVDAQLASLFKTAPQPVPTHITPVILTNTGEQTMQIPAVVEESAAPAPKTVVPETPAVNTRESGEFTRQFTPPPVLRPSPAVPAASAPEAGEFTRQFAPPVLRPSPTPPTPPTSPAVPASEAGEFTRQFSATPLPETKLETKSPPKPAGEFTKLFQSPLRPAPAVPAVPETPVTGRQPGEFTQMLQAQRPASPPSSPPPGESSSSGEFTRFFQSPMTPSPSENPNIAPLTPPPTPTAGPRGAGEFTQIFGRGDLPSPPPPPAAAAPPTSSSGNATQVFAVPRPVVPVASSPFSSPLSPGSNAPQSAAPQGPGEYTRMFSAPAPLTFGQPPVPQRMPQASPPTSTGNSSRLPLLLMVSAILLLVVALLVYFMMRPHSG